MKLRSHLQQHCLVGEYFLVQLRLLRQSGIVGQKDVASPGSSRPHVAAEETAVLRAQKTAVETPAEQTQPGPGPTYGQHF